MQGYARRGKTRRSRSPGSAIDFIHVLELSTGPDVP